MFISTGLTIDGTDVTDLIAYNGVKWTRNDIDGPNTGRTLSGKMVRDRVATKIRLDITCRAMTLSELRPLLNLIYPVFVSVTYDDPMLGNVTKVMYSNNNGASLLQKVSDTDEMWTGITFPLVEQ